MADNKKVEKEEDKPMPDRFTWSEEDDLEIKLPDKKK